MFRSIDRLLCNIYSNSVASSKLKKAKGAWMGVLAFLNKKDKHYYHTRKIDINLFLTNSGDNSKTIKHIFMIPK